MIQSVSSAAAASVASAPAQVPNAAKAAAQAAPAGDSATISPEGRALLAAEQAPAPT
ncbi:MAG: hypothetical protein ACI8TQ_004069 [Planctomycetota bacterium]|jgi:hypothetical protein